MRNQCNSLEEIAPENGKMLKSCLPDSLKHTLHIKRTFIKRLLNRIELIAYSTSSVRCSNVLFLALTRCSLLGTGELSTTVVKPGGGLYTLQYAFSWLSVTILSPFFLSLASRSYWGNIDKKTFKYFNILNISILRMWLHCKYGSQYFDYVRILNHPKPFRQPWIRLIWQTRREFIKVENLANRKRKSFMLKS